MSRANNTLETSSIPRLSDNLFARSTGCLDWVCPSCSALNKTHRKAQYKALYCKNCKSHWEHGIVLYPKPHGKTMIPRDTIFIGSAFTMRRTVNRAYCDHCGKTLTKPST